MVFRVWYFIIYASHAQVWKDALATKQKLPYMRHHLGGEVIHDMAFAPYEDVLGVGHAGGFASMLVPGAGEPNFDAFEANPFASKKQKREMEIHQLLEKIPASAITLDPDTVGKVDKAPKEVREAEKRKELEANEAKPQDKERKKKGKSSAIRKAMRRDGNIWDKRKVRASDTITTSVNSFSSIFKRRRSARRRRSM